MLQRTQPRHIERTYEVRGTENATEFLEVLARKGGRLLKGGEADVDGVAKMVLNDFLRGKRKRRSEKQMPLIRFILTPKLNSVPWYTPPPLIEGKDGEKPEGIEGRKGALGEMGKVRKQEEDEPEAEGPSIDPETEAPHENPVRPTKRRKKG